MHEMQACSLETEHIYITTQNKQNITICGRLKVNYRPHNIEYLLTRSDNL